MINLIFLFLVAKGWAGGDVTCWNKSCFENGWTWTNTITGQMVDYACYKDGCDLSGWIIGNFPNQAHTQCKPQGCFVEGWYLINSQNQQVIQQINCREQNSEKSCLKYGWTIYSFNGLDAVITCFDKSCEHKGWAYQTSRYINHANCKPEGCFKQGWREIQLK